MAIPANPEKRKRLDAFGSVQCTYKTDEVVTEYITYTSESEEENGSKPLFLVNSWFAAQKIQGVVRGYLVRKGAVA